MITYCIRRRVLQKRSHCGKQCRHLIGKVTRGLCSENVDNTVTNTLMKLCTDHAFITSDEWHVRALRDGKSCGYGPLGTELKKNLLEQWWDSVRRSRARLFGIHTLQHVATNAKENLRLIDPCALDRLTRNNQTTQQVIDELRQLLIRSPSIRSSLFQGALEQYLHTLELVNHKLPFGLAETGTCYQPVGQNTTDTDGSTEMTEASMVWFCSPRTSSQWLDHWARHRLKWWRKFALNPSDFNSEEVIETEMLGGASRGVQVTFRFPWGPEPLETLRNLGDSELLRVHRKDKVKLQCKDGRKSVVPHVVSVSGNMDRGLLAYLFNSLQLEKKSSSRQKIFQRKVLKLHPSLAPVKVALDMGRGATMELRQVCEGLITEFLESDISVWPGYLETMPQTMEQLHTKYDEMGVLFTVMITENTLENGLLLVRNRDTTIRETMHISEVKKYLQKYIDAADNI